MATAKKKTIAVVLESPQPKKHSVRFDSPRDDDWLSTLYLKNEAMAELDNPAKIRVTIEAA